MRILSLDEVPENWKQTMTHAGESRYAIFQGDIQAFVPDLTTLSASRVAKILRKMEEQSDFPYKNITRKMKADSRTCQTTSGSGVFGIVIQDGNGELQFLGGELDYDKTKCEDFSGLKISL